MNFHLISWCGYFVETVSDGNCVSTKFPHQEIRWNFGILYRVKVASIGNPDWERKAKCQRNNFLR